MPLRFGCVSLLAVTGLGAVVGVVVRDVINDRAVAQAGRTGILAERILAERLDSSLFARSLAAPEAAYLDGVIASSGSSLRTLRLWSTDGHLRYDSGRGALDGRHPVGPELATAIAGSPAARLIGGSHAGELDGSGTLLQMHLPVNDTPAGPAVGVLELHLPYGGAAQEAQTTTRQLLAVLGIALIAVWLLALRAATVSRRLRAQALHYADLVAADALTGSPDPGTLPATARQAGGQATEVADTLALAGDLRRALADGADGGGLWMAYQPTWDLQGEGHCTLVEALVRWDHPVFGAIPPDRFVHLAETTGLIRSLTGFVLEESLRQVRAWADDGLELHVAINLSSCNLGEEDLPSVVADLLRRHQIPAQWVVFEITESADIVDPERAARVLHQLVDLGAELAIDDFGTGWSSLSRLLDLPLTALKVDRSFVADLPDGVGAAVVTATVTLGHELDMFVVAEGVETPAQLQRLVELGCDVGQGYLFAAPLRPHEVRAVVTRNLVEQGWLPPLAVGRHSAVR